jgi:hypothetical protein
MMRSLTRRWRRDARLASAVATLLLVQLSAPMARAAPPSAEDVASAERLANEAYDQQAAGKFAEAIASYLKAYEISKTGIILLNVATLYDRKLHERSLASEYYRRYVLATDADPDHVKRATERLVALQRELETERQNAAVPPVAPAPAAPSAAPVTPPPKLTASDAGSTVKTLNDGGRWRTAGIVVGATGIASVGASMVLGLVAKGKNSDANALCNGAACTSDRGVSLAHDAGTFATASTITFVAGLLLVGGGITMYLVAPRTTAGATSASVRIAPQVGTTSAGMSLHGSF